MTGNEGSGGESTGHVGPHWTGQGLLWEVVADRGLVSK